MVITTTPELEEYLQASSIPFRMITPLDSALTNFVWRIQTPDGESTVIKHAEAFVRGIPSMPISVNRMDFEHRALTLIPSDIPYDGLIQLPRVIAYDSKAHVLQLADVGSRTLERVYGDYSMQIPKLGSKMGSWLARLHSRTRGDGAGAIALRQSLDNPIARESYRRVYAGLASSMSLCSLDPAVGEQIDENYGSLLATDADCVCHGDFWPGNVLVDRTICYGTTLKLSVVDWEMVRVGCGATDVGQFAAEAWLLDRFRGGRGLLERFLEGYREVAGPLDEAFLERVGAHFGAHLACWPTQVECGTKEDTQEVVRFGFDLLNKVLQRDWASVRSTLPGL